MIKFPPFDKDLGKDIKTVDIEGHKPTHASILLLWYSKPTSDIKNVCEIGSGTGFVSFGLSKYYNLKVVGIEKEKEFYDRALIGIELNNISNVEFVNCDVAQVKKYFKPESFDMVVFNPPYHFNSKSPNKYREASRKADKELIDNFISGASYILRNRGTFVCVVAPYRLVTFLTKLREKKLMPQQMCLAYGKKAELVLIRGRKNGGEHLEIDPPVYLK
ncbi:MAG: methyltransferase [Thermosipho sp. (in: Bacteria)]|nr:methyltransferase [Thermosipho sp. (in: thermotogales)]